MFAKKKTWQRPLRKERLANLDSQKSGQKCIASARVAQAFMGPYVIRAPQQRILNDELFDTVLHKVTTVSKLRCPVVVHLAGANLHFQHLQRLTNHFEQTQTRVFALDMSMNRTGPL